VTFRTAELECFTIITNKGYAVAWVTRRRAKETVVDPHLNLHGASENKDDEKIILGIL
jgi:hypothetical protein